MDSNDPRYVDIDDHQKGTDAIVEAEVPAEPSAVADREAGPEIYNEMVRAREERCERRYFGRS